ncbi:MAG: hypothetical protein ACRBF0_05715 [Calditrichia bacterium]
MAGITIHDNMVFRVNSKRSPSEMKLKSLEWAIVTQLNGEKSVSQIGEILALNMDETHELFERLEKAGLLELVESNGNDPYVSAELFSELEYRLTYYLGPVAAILVDDMLRELKRSRANLDKRQLPQLVELLTMEISNDEKRIEFQREMLQKLKGLI